MYHASKSTIVNNIIDTCGIGIWADTYGADNSSGQGTVVSNNQIHNCSQYGIYAEELCGSSFNNNNIYKCGIGIYGGAGFKYVSFVNNNISFCNKGMLVSNEHVPQPMISYFNQDCNLKGNTICYNESHGVILRGLKGVWTIEGNDIFNNNTLNADGVYAFVVADDPTNSQASQTVIFSNNRVHNEGRTVLGKEGYQQGVFIKCSKCVIQNNYFNNKVEDLSSYYSKPVLSANIFNTKVTISGQDSKDFGNIGYEEGSIVTNAAKGIKISKGLSTLPTPTTGDEGRIVKIDRTSENDELYYICKRKADGTRIWVEIFK